jgi:hypothetical protein
MRTTGREGDSAARAGVPAAHRAQRKRTVKKFPDNLERIIPSHVPVTVGV